MYVGKRHGLLRMKDEGQAKESKEEGARKRKDGLGVGFGLWLGCVGLMSNKTFPLREVPYEVL